MSDTADDFVRREVSKLLNVDYRGKFMCASCLLKFAVERFGTTLYTRGRSSGRWTRYSALPAPSDEYIDSSVTIAGRRCRVSPQPRPVQGSRPDPLSHFLCRLSKASDQSCRPRGLACMSPSPSLSPLWLSLPSAKTQRMACVAHSPARGPPCRARGAAGLSTKAAAPPARLTR